MHQAKFLVGLFFTFLTTIGALAAPVFDDPRELIAYAYEPYATDEFPEDPFELFSTSLRSLIQADAERASEDATGALNFDPFVDAQDFSNVSVSIGDVSLEGSQVLVSAIVTNFGKPLILTFSVVKQSDGWRIDDIISATPDQEWRLSELLTANPLDN